jgi:hypothetical protein
MIRFSGLATVLLLIAAAAKAEIEVPILGCPCAYLPEFQNPDCQHQERCVFKSIGAAVFVPNPVAPREFVFFGGTCDSCGNPCDGMTMTITQTASIADTGTVSVGGSVNVEVQAMINSVLAGALGIDTEAEFNAGHSSSTTVTQSQQFSCTVSCGPCRASQVEFYVSQRVGTATAPLQYAFQTRSLCPGEGWTAWRDNNPCETVASIGGVNQSFAGCRNRKLPCGDIDCHAGSETECDPTDPD